MRLLYYIMDRVETAEAIATTLKRLGIGEESYRITQRDGVPIKPTFEASGDAVEMPNSADGDKGSLIGALCGLLFVLWIAVMRPMGLSMNLLVFLGLSAVLGVIGAWVGRMVCTSYDADRRSPLQELMQRRSCRMVIGVSSINNAREVRHLIRHFHPEAVFEAEDVAALSTSVSQMKLRMRHT